MLKKIYEELVLIRKELQIINKNLELSEAKIDGEAIAQAVRLATRGMRVKSKE